MFNPRYSPTIRGLLLWTIVSIGRVWPELSCAPVIQALTPEVQQALATIRPSGLLATVRFLASPRLEGRRAGEPGAKIAADYLSSRFEAAGIRPGSKEGFLQRFELLHRVLAADESLTLTRSVDGSMTARTFALSDEWLPFDFSEIGEIEAPIVFAGYGIVAPEYGWDDYAPLGQGGARGKIVIAFRHEPDQDGASGAEFFEGREMTLHASLRQKARVAAAHGAVGLIVVDDPAGHGPTASPSSSRSRWAILTEEQRRLPVGDPGRPRGAARVQGEDTPLGIVAALASQELLRWIDPTRNWKSLRQAMDASRRPQAVSLTELRARVVHAYSLDRRPTANVLGILRGSDPDLSNQFVLVGGHYDHLGKDSRTGEIYPGADDNASGIAAVLAVAEAFASLPVPPVRSLIFAGWSAEELGLLGSAYFVREPTVKLGDVVAGINLDMVGRNKEVEMSVVGRAEVPDLVEIFDRFAPTIGLSLNDDASAGATRSDNGSLWLGGIPTASLFSGIHEDYHQPEDTAVKVIPGKIERAAQLAFLVAYEIASGRSTPARLSVPMGPWNPIAPVSARPVVLGVDP